MNATTASGATVIELENISKVFYADSLQTNALSEVNLVINRGEFVSITGPSGCGKSTLMAILGILDAPTSGRYLFDGNDLAGVSVAEAAHIRCREIGFVFQSFNLIGDLTVLENIVVPLTYRDDIGKRQSEELAMAALDQVGPSSIDGDDIPFGGYAASAGSCAIFLQCQGGGILGAVGSV